MLGRGLLHPGFGICWPWHIACLCLPVALPSCLVGVKYSGWLTPSYMHKHPNRHHSYSTNIAHSTTYFPWWLSLISWLNKIYIFQPMTDTLSNWPAIIEQSSGAVNVGMSKHKRVWPIQCQCLSIGKLNDVYIMCKLLLHNTNPSYLGLWNWEYKDPALEITKKQVLWPFVFGEGVSR